jgi:hypothetical protein
MMSLSVGDTLSAAGPGKCSTRQNFPFRVARVVDRRPDGSDPAALPSQCLGAGSKRTRHAVVLGSSKQNPSWPKTRRPIRIHMGLRQYLILDQRNWTSIMPAADLPWDDTAALVKELGAGDREIAAEGSLRAITAEIATWSQPAWRRYRIVLPDRASSPFAFEPESFAFLIGRLKTA